MKRIGLIGLLVLLAALAVPVFAQDTPAPEATDAANAVGQADVTETPEAATTAPQVVRFRIAHLIPDGPPITTFVDGEPSDIQLLAFPAVTGWIEVPGAAAQLAFVPEGNQLSAAVASPVVVSASTGFTTIALIGSAEGGTAQAVRFSENLGGLAENCARVTVFNAVEGSAGFNLAQDGTTLFETDLAFPGGTSGQQGSTDLFGDECDTGTGTMVSAVQCFALPADQLITTDSAGAVETTGDTTPDAMATVEADATSQATTGASGQSLGNCAYTFDVPAGTYTWDLSSVGDAAVPPFTSSYEIEPDTYVFVAFIGTADVPEVFTFTVGGGALSPLLGDEADAMNEMGDTDDSGDMSVTPEATAETTPGA
jgi:hypothetical protein